MFELTRPEKWELVAFAFILILLSIALEIV
jgi:hypothetical protein